MPATPVKSAARALEVLEYFANRRAPAGVAELASALQWPRSSTSMLLASLVTLGYLRQDPETRRFRPTERVALLGAWIERDTGVQGLLEALRDRTGETVILAQRNGLDSQYIQVLESTGDLRLILRMGTRRPLVRAATGYALLAGIGDAEIARILRKCNADAAAKHQVEPRDLMFRVNQVRARGYAFSESQFTKGGALIAAPLPVRATSSPLVVGVGGPTERIRLAERHIVAMLREVLGPPGSPA